MVNETKTLFYSEELNEDINQNSSLLKSKEILTYNKTSEQINTNSYNSIVDSIDYLGCINGNCSKIKCDCNNANCDCNQSQTHTNNQHHNNQHHNNQHHNNQHKTSFISNLVDFIFVLFIIIVLITILYTRNAQHLLYVLGITIVYIFYKIYIISS
jgi:Ca2+/Na+ antiporter